MNSTKDLLLAEKLFLLKKRYEIVVINESNSDSDDLNDLTDLNEDALDFDEAALINETESVQLHVATEAVTERKSLWQRFIENMKGNAKVTNEQEEDAFTHTPLQHRQSHAKYTASASHYLPTKLRKSSLPISNISYKSLFPYPPPAYKYLQGTSWLIDAFAFAPTTSESSSTSLRYFLTHFHADHYGGLTRHSWHQPIYTGAITARLCQHRLKVNSSRLVIIPESGLILDHIQILLVEADHCPGAKMLLFLMPHGRRYLHMGDCRASKRLLKHLSRALEKADELQYGAVLQESEHLELKLPPKPKYSLDAVYLDTTYLSAKMPGASLSRKRACQLASRLIYRECIETNRLPYRLMPLSFIVLIGAYTIGKERLIFTIAQQLNCKVFATREKQAIWQCLPLPDHWQKRITSEPREALVHVVGMHQLSQEALSHYLDQSSSFANHLLAVQGTAIHQRGMGHEPTFKSISYKGTLFATSTDRIRKLTISYSEHSSRDELHRLVKWLPAKQWIATVGDNRLLQEQLQEWQRVPLEALPDQEESSEDEMNLI